MIEANRQTEGPKVPTGKELGLVFSAFFLFLSFTPLLKGKPFRFSTLWLAILFFLLAFLFPKALHPLGKIWLKLGLVMHRVMNPLILGIVFYVILSPMAALLRLFGKTFLQLGWDKDRKSYWIERDPPGPDPQSFGQQF